MEKNHQLIATLEAILFISGEPLALSRIAKVLNVSEDVAEQTLSALAERYEKDTTSGLIIIKNDREARIATKPKQATAIEDLTKSTLQEHLSKAALEVLAIIAYRTPITRTEIDAIRGVNCSFTLRNLLLRGLIEREGNPEDARGYRYRPSFRFLETLGIRTAHELPDFKTLSKDERLTMLFNEPSAEITPDTETSQPSAS